MIHERIKVQCKCSFPSETVRREKTKKFGEIVSRIRIFKKECGSIRLSELAHE